MMACRPLSAMMFSSLSAGPVGWLSPCSHLRTVEADVCRWSANTGWLNFRPSRRRLMSAAPNSRTGGGQIASNSRIVTLLIAPASTSAARSPRSDSMTLLTVHLHQYTRVQCPRQGFAGQFQEHLARELAGPSPLPGCVRPGPPGETVPEPLPVRQPGRQPRAIGGGPYATRGGPPPFFGGAGQVCVDQAALHFLDCLAQNSIGE